MSLSAEEIQRIRQIQAKHNNDHFCGAGCPPNCDIAFLISLAYRQFPMPPGVPERWTTSQR
jgi:hypothetical protein